MESGFIPKKKDIDRKFLKIILNGQNKSKEDLQTTS